MTSAPRRNLAVGGHRDLAQEVVGDGADAHVIVAAEERTAGVGLAAAVLVDVALVELEHRRAAGRGERRRQPEQAHDKSLPPRRAHQKRPVTTSPPPVGEAIGSSASDGAVGSERNPR